MSRNSHDQPAQQVVPDPLGLINCIEDAILVLDTRGSVVFVNKTGEEFFGKSAKEIVGRRAAELFPDSKEMGMLVRKAIREARSFSARDMEVRVNGVTTVDFRISPFFSGDKHTGSLLSIRENVSIVEKEDASFDSLVYLIGSIAHEIKNPLGGIRGAAQLLEKGLAERKTARGAAKNASSSDGIRECLTLIIRETDRLDAVLHSYLTMSRKPVLHPTNIHEVLEKGISIMDMSCTEGKISIQRFYDPSLPRVLGDEAKLLQVFVNIVKNAIEAMPRGGDLSIATRPSGEYVVQNGQTKRWAVISVGDSGRGIPKNELQKIFLPFYTKKKQGTGLGLALSKKIIKDHNGFIRVESPASSGRGTVFHVYIPFATA